MQIYKWHFFLVIQRVNVQFSSSHLQKDERALQHGPIEVLHLFPPPVVREAKWERNVSLFPLVSSAWMGYHGCLQPEWDTMDFCFSWRDCKENDRSSLKHWQRWFSHYKSVQHTVMYLSVAQPIWNVFPDLVWLRVSNLIKFRKVKEEMQQKGVRDVLKEQPKQGGWRKRK